MVDSRRRPDGMVTGLRLLNYPEDRPPAARDLRPVGGPPRSPSGMYMIVQQRTRSSFFGDTVFQQHRPRCRHPRRTIHRPDGPTWPSRCFGLTRPRARREMILVLPTSASVRPPGRQPASTARSTSSATARPDLEIDGEMQPEIALDPRPRTPAALRLSRALTPAGPTPSCSARSPRATPPTRSPRRDGRRVRPSARSCSASPSRSPPMPERRHRRGDRHT